MHNGPVSFKVGIQVLKAQSTMEVELMAGAYATREAVYCQSMMTDLDFKEEFKRVQLHIDNTWALYVAENQTYNSRAKHMVSSARLSRRDT